ncbi:MAG: 16S rRNA (adenine(1518)-N(6)/adenine(1519)-N(6))-dimethyltransferase RsmA [Planctomycetota bacterium]|nr:16S rRNA (adenine(1518)-N(6)/adenine(1519)-N(6))-dimethyltransferase RsmA [Planctomycetota bacterium]MDA1106672.1 16S rRNA (adenine(1518)-N(6)/adenine(1519)-N(6))-dimethyltransferase RsmA [Planctomycetota bacterium]
MQTLTDIKSLLASRDIRPRHRFGQNFLHDHNLIRRLIDASGVRAGDRVLEVGPGTGALTEPLVEMGCTVIACEIDRDMQAIVRERLGERVMLIEGDCLDGKHALSAELARALGSEPFTLVANLPYQAATPLMAILLADYPQCQGQFVTIQKEVAQRLAAKPGDDQWGAISLLATVFSRVEWLATLPASCFWPAPEVTSAMIALHTLTPRPSVDAHALGVFAQRLFCKRRKQLGAVLGRDFPFPPDIDPCVRAETLRPEQVIMLMERA